MARKKNDQPKHPTEAPRQPHTSAQPQALTIDYALYDRYLEDSGWSDQQKREFLDAMWSIIVEFVMLGFEVHPAQQAQEACGKLDGRRSELPKSRPDSVELTNSRKAQFRDAAGDHLSPVAERIQE